VKRREAGQTLVEFSLVVAFIFFPLLFGLIEGARLVYTNNVLSNAAREGARRGSVQAGWIGQAGNGCSPTDGPTVHGPVCPSQSDFITNVLSAANGEMVGANPLSTAASDPDHSVTVTCNGLAPSQSSCATGGTLRITVAYRYVPLLPILSNGSIRLSAAASMAIQ
jgi:hypothetical protein